MILLFGFFYKISGSPNDTNKSEFCYKQTTNSTNYKRRLTNEKER